MPLQLTVLRDEEPGDFVTVLDRSLDAIFLLDVVLQVHMRCELYAG